MNYRDFLVRLGAVAALGVLLAAGLRLGMGARWFAFYGWGTVAVATMPFLAAIFWRRLPSAGRSSYWSLLLAVPVLLAAIVQVAYWALFFNLGPRNPTFGIGREMVRPWLEAGEPFAVAAYAAFAVWLFWRSGPGAVGRP